MTRTLLKNAMVFDGTGIDRFLGSVLINGDRIEAILRHPEILHTDCTVLDCRRATLMPGLVDAHAHLAFGTTVEKLNRPRQRPPEEAALVIAHCGRVLLDHGFTSAYSGGCAQPSAEIMASKAFDEGLLPGPRLRTCSFERTPGGTQGGATSFPGTSREAEPASVAEFVRSMAADGVDSVKFVLNGVSAWVPGSNLVDQFHASEIAAAGVAAREHRVRLTAHAYTPEMIELAANNGFTVIYHCNWANERAMDALEANKDHIFVAPGPGITEADLLYAPKFEVMASESQRMEQTESVERIKWLGKELRRRGIKSLPGGDYGLPWNPIGRNARDIELFVEWFGYSPMAALISATQLGGELMNLELPVGLVAEGYAADILIVDGDPTSDVSVLTDKKKILAVIKGGEFHRTIPFYFRQQPPHP
ncbi:amidohydrolase family protein [Caballeronia sp. DA-9]|uniref:amidohydrolase family protein n=1 Tax=Caballeronia sp. DA-9 TaxID=3436237 RepID=UPI003F6642A1